MNPKNPIVIAVAIAALAVAALAGAMIAGSDDDDDTALASPIATQTTAAPQAAAQAQEQVAVSDDDDDAVVDADDQPMNAGEIDRVSAAALEIAGGGTVTDVDRSDDVGEAYEVEIATETGEIDIALDERLERVPNLRYDD
jgi:hypothetical protein